MLTNAAAPVIASRVLELGPNAVLGWAATGPCWHRVGGAREVEEVRALGVVKLKRAGQSLQHTFRHPVHVPALEAGVVRDADAGEDGDLLAAQAGHATSTVGRQSGLLWCDPAAAGGQEFADLVLGVHEIQSRPLWMRLGDPVSSPFTGTLSFGGSVLLCRYRTTRRKGQT